VIAEWVLAGSALLTALTNAWLGFRHRRYDNIRFSTHGHRIRLLENGVRALENGAAREPDQPG
jgi:hypothetical protein